MSFRTTTLCLVASFLMLAPAIAGAGENLLPQGDFGETIKTQSDLFSQWTAGKDWMKSRFKLMGEGAGAYIRVNEVPARMSTELEFPEGLAKVVLATRTRQKDFEPGDKGWDVPTINLTIITKDGEEIKDWKNTIKYRGSDGWVIEKMTYQIPEGATGRVKITYKGSGDFDIDWIKLYNPDDPVELSEDAE